MNSSYAEQIYFAPSSEWIWRCRAPSIYKISGVTHLRFPSYLTGSEFFGNRKLLITSQPLKINDSALQQSCLSRRDLYFIYRGQWPLSWPSTSRSKTKKKLFSTFAVFFMKVLRTNNNVKFWHFLWSDPIGWKTSHS